jgi:Na+/proline symporter
LRWFWWRINAWSEIAAMVVAAAVSLFLQSEKCARFTEWLHLPAAYKLPWNGDDPQQFAYLMLTTVVITTIAWLAVTLLTPPEPLDKLAAFYRRVRPAGPGWTAVAAKAADSSAVPNESLGMQFFNWVLGCVLIYSTLFGIGKLIFKEWLVGAALLAVALVVAALISRNLSRADWSDTSEPG